MNQTAATQVSASIASDLQVQIVRGKSGFKQIATNWARIAAAMAESHCFHLSEWYSSYLGCLAAQPDNSVFFVVQQFGQPVAIFPFDYTKRRVGILTEHVLELANHSHLPFTDFILSPDCDIAQCTEVVMNELRQNEFVWDTILMPRILGHSAAASWQSQLSREMKVIVNDEQACDYMPLQPYDELLAALSGKARSNIRRARKRAEQTDGFAHSYATTFPDLEDAFQEFLRLEASGWKGQRGSQTAIQLDNRLVDFYRTLLTELAPSGRCAIHLLHADGQAFCASFGLICNQTFYGLKMGYDEQYKSLSPGSLLQDCIVRHYENSTDVRCMNLISHSPWQRAWNPQSYACLSIKLYRRTLRGRMLFGQSRLFRIAKAVVHRLKSLVKSR